MNFGSHSRRWCPPTSCGRRSASPSSSRCSRAQPQPRRLRAHACTGTVRAGARQSLDHSGGPRAADLGGGGGGRQEPEPGIRRPHAADRGGARRSSRNGSAACPASRCGSSRPASPTARPTGPGCSARLSAALTDVPHDRVAGAIVITDGRVHDVPSEAAALGFAAPVHGADHRPQQRARPPRRAHERAALRHRRAVADHHLPRRGSGRPADAGTGDGTARRRDHRESQRPRRRERQHQRANLPCRAEHRRDRGLAARWRAHRHQQPRGGLDRRRARQAARPAGVGRAARRRARLAQPSQVRRQRRSRAFHHPAPAREAGRHPDQRTVADRIPDPRAVPAEDQRVPADHFRPLRPPGRAADHLFRQYRPLCAPGRRRAGGGGPRLCQPDQHLAHAARRHPARRAERAHQ